MSAGQNRDVTGHGEGEGGKRSLDVRKQNKYIIAYLYFLIHLEETILSDQAKSSKKPVIYSLNLRNHINIILSKEKKAKAGAKFSYFPGRPGVDSRDSRKILLGILMGFLRFLSISIRFRIFRWDSFQRIDTRFLQWFFVFHVFVIHGFRLLANFKFHLFVIL